MFPITASTLFHGHLYTFSSCALNKFSILKHSHKLNKNSNITIINLIIMMLNKHLLIPFSPNIVKNLWKMLRKILQS